MRRLRQFLTAAAAGNGLALLLAACQPEGTDPAETSQQAAAGPAAGALQLHVPSPDWRDQIVYFVMIDRFADGQPSNNDQGAGEYESGNNAKFQGGDLIGIRQQLDYIQGLGATALWLTPPVANQWWDGTVNYGGYHGYWAENFKQVDAHFGTLDDYRQLSDALHRRGMYLVQDIVVNHTGNFFRYHGGWSADDPSQFFQLNTQSVPVTRPTQAPFDRNDVRDEAQRTDAIYHWTPTIANVSNLDQERNHQLADLDDLNTENPQVRHALRDSYGYWIREVGVDAFRVDTAFYVAPEYFRDFLQADDSSAPGILTVARQTGRDHFHAFGEGFGVDQAFDDRLSRKIDGYMRTPAGESLLPGMINFPLYGTMTDVFARGRPTAELDHRLRNMMQVYAAPQLMPTFVDNHDVDRFLTGADTAALKQALLFIMTVPGIPTIYYGTEQGFSGQRDSMFAHGVGSSGRDRFDTEAPLYRYLQQITALRKQHKVLSRGKPVVLASSSAGPGVLAYRMEAEDEPLLILFNSADQAALIDNIDTGLPGGSQLATRFAIDGSSPTYRVDSSGRLSLSLPARAGVVLALDPQASTASTTASTTSAAAATTTTATTTTATTLTVVGPESNRFTGDFTISGKGPAATTLSLVIDGQLGKAQKVMTDSNGRWQAHIDTRDFVDPAITHQLVAWSADSAQASHRYTFTVQRQWQALADVQDPAGDDRGPNGRYHYPTEASWLDHRPMDLRRIKVASSGAALQIEITLQELMAIWNPSNGFDHLALTVFLQAPGKGGGSTVQPLQSTILPGDMRWHYRARVHGWSNALFRVDGADAMHEGRSVAPGASLSVNPSTNTITLRFPAAAFPDISNWQGGRLYLNSWDYDSGYKPLAKQLDRNFVSSDGQSEALLMDDVPVISLKK